MLNQALGKLRLFKHLFGKHRFGNVFPPTWRGVFVALASALALSSYGYDSLDLLLFVIGIAGLVLTLLSSLAVGGAALYLHRRIEDDGVGFRRLEAGSPIRTGFSAPALEFLPLVRLHWEWIEPAGVDCRLRLRNHRLLEEVVARRRCQVAGIRRRITVFDAFGLAQITWQHSAPTPLVTLPNIGRLRRMPVLQSLAAAEGIPYPSGTPEGDRMEIRRYVPGDSMRHILWKIYARTRQLNVRTPERSIDPSKKTVAYLLAGESDEAAAAAARVALENGLLGLSWTFGADGTDTPTDSLEEALVAIARSGSLPERHASGLHSFLHHSEVAGEMHCIVFASSRRGPWTDEALDAGRRFTGTLTFVLGTDGVVEQRPVPLWKRVLFFDQPVEGPTAQELQALVRTLSSAGHPVLVVDRHTGRAQGSGHQPQQMMGASA
jgi:hypothetical protein